MACVVILSLSVGIGIAVRETMPNFVVTVVGIRVIIVREAGATGSIQRWPTQIFVGRKVILSVGILDQCLVNA